MRVNLLTSQSVLLYSLKTKDIGVRGATIVSNYALRTGCHLDVSSFDVTVVALPGVLGCLENPLVAGRTMHLYFWLGRLLHPCLGQLQNVGSTDQRIFAKFIPWAGL